MKKFLLMFAAVAAIAFVGCKTETKPAEEVAPEQTEEVAPTVESVTADLLNAADEATAVSLLDGGDQAGYFNIINIIKTVWENNKDAILAKIPTLADKMTNYIDVPEDLKAGFADFVAKAAAEKVEGAVNAATDAAGAAVDAAKDKAAETVDAAKNAAGDAVDAAKAKGADAAQAVADELKK